MGVEAGRIALAGAPDGVPAGPGGFATTAPAYLDKTNATAIHAALGLPTRSPPSTLGAPSGRASARGRSWPRRRRSPCCPTCAPVGPDGADEAAGGDGAAALLFGDDGSIAEIVGRAAVDAAEFLDRWRTPGEHHSQVWEERFGEHVYVPLAEQALTDALKGTGITLDEVDHVVVTGTHARAVRGVAKASGPGPRPSSTTSPPPSATPAPPTRRCCWPTCSTGPQPGQIDRCWSCSPTAPTSWLLRTTDALAALPAGVDGRRAASRPARDDLPYPLFLTWRGLLHREPPRRPDPDRPAAPPSFPHEAWKYPHRQSVARATECGTPHLPPARVCVNCGAVDQMDRSSAWPTCRGTDRHVHRRPAGVLPQPAGRRRASSTSTAAVGSGAS